MCVCVCNVLKYNKYSVVAALCYVEHNCCVYYRRALLHASVLCECIMGSLGLCCVVVCRTEIESQTNAYYILVTET